MLVLSRRVNESIVIPDLGISIRVLKIKGNSVRIGVEAPSEIKVIRGELDVFAEKLSQHFELNQQVEFGCSNVASDVNEPTLA